jgi:membrane-associated phospholipid phosphatase
MSTLKTFVAGVAGAALVVACSEGAVVSPRVPALAASRSGAAFAAGLASPEWQDTAASLVAQARFIPQAAGRAYALLSVAQYLAVQRAEAAAGGGGGRSRLETDRGAVAGASVVVLSDLFPSQAEMLANVAIEEANAGPGDPHPAFAGGEAIGRSVGGEIVTRAHNDGFSRPFTGTIPSGPGLWISNTNPPTMVAGQLPGVTPWFLTSADQFRPAPPPAFGSAEFQAALAEIRALSDTRTAEQTQIAAFWAMNPGTSTPPGFWLHVATDGIGAHGLSEREATHVYALLSGAIFDALISCWDAKETYWFIRPWQADPSITVVAAVGKPNHPSYPSGHGCVSGAGAAVLGSFFPEERGRFDALAAEAGVSRLYAGIHYRFDVETGLQMGRSVAALAIAADASGTSVLTP